MDKDLKMRWVLGTFLVFFGNLSWGQGLKGKKVTPSVNCHGVFAISGGGNPSANHLRYYQNIDRVHDVYKNCPIFNFMATGNEDDPVTMVHENVTLPNGQTAEKIKMGPNGLPVLEAKKVKGGLQGAASVADIKRSMAEFVKTMEDPSGAHKNDDPVVIYVTDHGSLVEGKGQVSLWNRTYLSSNVMNELIGQLPEDKKVIMIYDQCYGGEMLKSIWGEGGRFRKNVCGIAAADPGQLAHSGGGSMRNLQEMKNQFFEGDLEPSQFTYQNLHQRMGQDNSIKSVPTLTSEIFANEWYHSKYTQNFAENISNGNFLDPRKQCFRANILDIMKKSQIPKSLLERAKEEWKGLYQKFLKGGKGSLDLSQLNVNIEEMTDRHTAATKAFDEFQLKTFNPHMVELYQKNYPHYEDYLVLKAKINSSGESLTDEEREKLKKFTFEIDLYREAVKNESQLKSKGAMTKFATDPSLKTMDVIGEFFSLQNTRGRTWNQLYQTKRQLRNLTNMNALDKMVKENDITALENYFNLVDCEKTPVLKGIL